VAHAAYISRLFQRGDSQLLWVNQDERYKEFIVMLNYATPAERVEGE
jgi:hypothetical protein